MEQNIKNLYADFQDKKGFKEIAAKELNVSESSLHKFLCGMEGRFEKITRQFDTLHKLAVNYHKSELHSHKLIHEQNA